MPELSKPHVASLNPAAVSRVEALEQSIGDVYVVAYEKPVEPAQLNPDQVKLLQQAETELGLCLIAYRA